MRHRLIDQLYEQIDKTSRELLQREAELVIVVDPETKEETLNITTSNPDLIKLLARLHNESLAFKKEVISISLDIQKLPSEDLKEIATFNQALSAAWNQARRHNGWVSMFFAANCLLVDSEPLVKTAKEELGNHGYEIAHAMADLVRRLWELLDTAHPLVRELLKKKDVPYPFQTSRELLVTIPECLTEVVESQPQ